MSQRVIEEQKRCIVSWCRNWNDEQRDQFVAKLEQTITGQADVDQVGFVASWFREWSEMQREDFLPVLAQSLSANFCPVNGLSELGLGSRPPSLFQCRVKLFREWCLGWDAACRQSLLDSLRDADPTFVQHLQAALSSLDGAKPPNLVANDPREGEVV